MYTEIIYILLVINALWLKISATSAITDNECENINLAHYVF